MHISSLTLKSRDAKITSAKEGEKIYKHATPKINNVNKCLLENCVYLLWVPVKGEDKKMLRTSVIYLFMLDIYFAACTGEGKYYNSIQDQSSW